MWHSCFKTVKFVMQGEGVKKRATPPRVQPEISVLTRINPVNEAQEIYPRSNESYGPAYQLSRPQFPKQAVRKIS